MRPVIQEEIEIRERAEDVLPRLFYEGPFKKSIDVADFYGFRLIEQPRTTRDDKITKGATSFPSERIALMRLYLEQSLDTCTQPVQLVYSYKVPYKQESQLKLDVIGTEKSIAEALILQTTLAILRDRGFENLYIAVNSVGGPLSKENFVRELTEYYRDRLNDLEDCCKQSFKENVYGPFSCSNGLCKEIRRNAPQSIGFLSEPSRKHFGEIIEYLETLGVSYRIENHLVGCKHYSTHTIFEIREDKENPHEDDPIVAFGERYDTLSKTSGLGRVIPAVGATILAEADPERETLREFKVNRVRNPKVYLVHLGAEAKRGSLRILEELRNARIPLETGLAEDSISRQLAYAKALSVPVIVIIGHKEILDGTAIVRIQDNHSQETVPQERLTAFLKKVI